MTGDPVRNAGGQGLVFGQVRPRRPRASAGRRPAVMARDRPAESVAKEVLTIADRVRSAVNFPVAAGMIAGRRAGVRPFGETGAISGDPRSTATCRRLLRAGM
jgi:hypothetical protein